MMGFTDGVLECIHLIVTSPKPTPCLFTNRVSVDDNDLHLQAKRKSSLFSLTKNGEPFSCPS